MPLFPLVVGAGRGFLPEALTIWGWSLFTLAAFASVLAVRARLPAWKRARVYARLPADASCQVERVDGKQRCWVEVSGAAGTVRLERNAGSWSAPAGWEPVQSGDSAFSTWIRSFGYPLHVHALLDADTRAAVVAAFEPWGRVVDGAVQLGLLDESAPHIEERVATARALAARLTLPRDLAGRLADITRGDPDAQVRRIAFAELCAYAPDHAAEIAPSLLGNRDPLLLVVAARLAGAAGLAVLATLRRHPADEVRIAALRATATLPDAVPLLVAHLDTWGDPTLVARCLAGTNAQAEPTLLRLLMEPDPATVHAAVDALGAVGTVVAVPILRALDMDPAREAARSIQGRLVGAQAGRLALADNDGGELSLASSGGELSMPELGPGRGSEGRGQRDVPVRQG